MARGAATAGSAGAGPGLDNAGLAGNAPIISTGWKRLDGWIAAIARTIDANHNECVQRSFHDRGKAADDAAGGGTGGGGAGAIGLPPYPATDGTYVLGVVITGDGDFANLAWLATDSCP